MNCYTCPAFPGFLEPVPGAGKNTYRPVCADHKGADAIPVDPGDMIALHLFGYEPIGTKGSEGR
jgi:hypothetical protein